MALKDEHESQMDKLEAIYKADMESMKTYYEGMGESWKAVGHDKGYGKGRREGFGEGICIGVQKGMEKGTYLGWNQGHDSGLEEGKGLGFGKGKDKGFSMGYCKGEDDHFDSVVFEAGEKEGHRKGWKKGHSEGVEAEQARRELDEERLRAEAYWEGHEKGWSDLTEEMAKKMREGRLEMTFIGKGKNIVLAGKDGEEDLMAYSTKGKRKGKKKTGQGKGAGKGKQMRAVAPFGGD